MANQRDELCDRLKERRDTVVDEIVDQLCDVQRSGGRTVDGLGEALSFGLGEEPKFYLENEYGWEAVLSDLRNPDTGSRGDLEDAWKNINVDSRVDLRDWGDLDYADTIGTFNVTVFLPGPNETVSEDVNVECDTDLTSVRDSMDTLQEIKEAHRQLCD